MTTVKLSKRHGAVSVMQYRDDGYLPEALLNRCVWAGLMAIVKFSAAKEMIDLFSELSGANPPVHLTLTAAVWLNHHCYQYHAAGNAYDLPVVAHWSRPILIPVFGPELRTVKLLGELQNSERDRRKLLLL